MAVTFLHVEEDVWNQADARHRREKAECSWNKVKVGEKWGASWGHGLLKDIKGLLPLKLCRRVITQKCLRGKKNCGPAHCIKKSKCWISRLYSRTGVLDLWLEFDISRRNVCTFKNTELCLCRKNSTICNLKFPLILCVHAWRSSVRWV